MKCSKCKEDKPTTEFFKRSDRKKGYTSMCKECLKSSRRKSYSKNVAKYRIYHSKPKNAERLWLQKVKRQYKLSLDQLTNLLNSQRGCCEVCGDSLVHPSSKRNYHIDHNHDTGEVRGLLCQHCNRAYGAVRESDVIIKSLLDYHYKYS